MPQIWLRPYMPGQWATEAAPSRGWADSRLPGTLAAATKPHHKSHDTTGVIRSFSIPTDATKSPRNSLNIRAQVRRYVTTAETSTKKARQYDAHMSPIVGRGNQFVGVSFLR